MKINLSDLVLLNRYSDAVPLSDLYDEKEIISLMVEYWIPLFECHKCGKWDYCKYIERHPIYPDKSVEIQCGVAIDFITNFINTTFSLIETLSKEQKQSYLNSAYYMTCFSQSSEQLIGNYINKDYLEGWGKYAPSLYGYSKSTMDFLTQAHKEMKNVPFFNSKKSVLFVEGESEEIFANRFLDIEVENYGGEGRIQYDKIEYLFKKYLDRGYKIFIQADKDGKVTNQRINKIILKGLIPKDNIFCFTYDFETALPTRVFHKLLVENKFIDDDYVSFINGYTKQKSIVKYAESKYSFSLNKPFLAIKICDFIDSMSHQINLYTDEDFLSVEMGQFWLFLKTKIVY